MPDLSPAPAASGRRAPARRRRAGTGPPQAPPAPRQGPPGQPPPAQGQPPPAPALRLLERAEAAGRLTHVTRLPAREGRAVPWPSWVPAGLAAAFARTGVPLPWEHQAAAAEHARAGRGVILATGTASGKSVGYLAPALTAIGEGATALYLAPTRALAADQLRLVEGLAAAWDHGPGPEGRQAPAAGPRRARGSWPGPRAAVVDSDTPPGQRAWARQHATYLLTTPDMLHHALLPQHRRWHGFYRRLRYVIVDECHGYRGVFGSHVAQVLRRLRRVAEHHREPGAPGLTFVLASATIGDPAAFAELLTGLPAVPVTGDASPRPDRTFALWQPPLTAPARPGPAIRRSAVAEAGDMLADLVRAGVPALAFVRSRRAAEEAAAAAKGRLADLGAAGLAGRVAAYRSGYLPNERRQLERALRSGQVTALAATSALELGVDITGLDAVVIAGWPGSRSALWQRAGRAGRAGRPAVAVLIAGDDPLDTYLVHHPDALFGQPVESAVLDPGNPYILAPHLYAAAAELPLTEADLAMFGAPARAAVAGLVAAGRMRDRGGRWHPAGPRRPVPASLRGAAGRPVRIVERSTGRLIGLIDEPSAHVFAHAGAVYAHQGEPYLITSLDLGDRVALAEAGDPGYVTAARQRTGLAVAAERRGEAWGEATVHFGDVVVTRQVTSFTRREPRTGRALGEEPLDLPERTLRTRAVWWTLSAGQRARLAGQGVDLAGAAHAAEHAAIGLLPLVAACDRWDVGGLSADSHPSTGRLTIFVYDGHDGGAGFAERGFAAAAHWLRATAQAIAGCECADGCPSCVQSPKCGSGNDPLSKPGAAALYAALLAVAPG